MTEFVLVHGAWHGAWCWRKTAPVLAEAGHRVHAPDLPGLGEDRTLADPDAAFPAYVERVAGVLSELPEPALLVGHSMGGAVVSQVAERVPERCAALVYLTAFLLRDGESIADVTKAEPPTAARAAQVLSADRKTMTIRSDAVREAFYGDCEEADAAEAAMRLVPQPVAPFFARLALSEDRFGTVPRFYVECLRDRAIDIAVQRKMQARQPCAAVLALDTDHSPFLSAPDALARHLLAIADRVGRG